MDADLAEAIAIEVFTLASNHAPYQPEHEAAVAPTEATVSCQEPERSSLVDGEAQREQP